MPTLIERAASVTNAMNAFGNGYNPVAKAKFHMAGRKFLKQYAVEVLKLDPGTYEVRSCIGGPAVLGEVTLHADNVYIQICQPCFDRTMNVMFRTCKNRTDYTGGSNNWCHLFELTQFNACERLRVPFFAH